jgi:hypothetical protein
MAQKGIRDAALGPHPCDHDGRVRDNLQWLHQMFDSSPDSKHRIATVSTRKTEIVAKSQLLLNSETGHSNLAVEFP